MDKINSYKPRLMPSVFIDNVYHIMSRLYSTYFDIDEELSIFVNAVSTFYFSFEIDYLREMYCLVKNDTECSVNNQHLNMGKLTTSPL